MSAYHRGKLYCYILRKSQSSFHVNIADCATVSELKEKILLKNKNSLVGVDEHQLKIWKHYMSTEDLKTQLASLQLCDGNALDGAVVLSREFSDACLGQIHVIAEVSGVSEGPSKRRKVDDEDQENDGDNILASLNELWNHAWGKPDATLFETREVNRDGTLPEVTTPNEYRVLTIPGNALRKFGVSTILIRHEYVIALMFAIFIAQGGSPPGPFDEEKNDAFEDEEDDPHPKPKSQDEWNSISQSNPFRSPEGQAHVPAKVGYVGHPGIGKTLFLFMVLALRILHSLPSIYMVKPDCMYIVDSRGARKILAKKFDQNSVTEEYWCLVDLNRELTTVPDDLLTLQCFLMQTASPRETRTDWWKKSPSIYVPFFMKEWSLPELIIGRILQNQPSASEQQINFFLSRYIASAREVFNYAAHPILYDTHITKELGALSRKKIQKIIHNARSLSFDGKVSHHVVLISPQMNRIEHRVEIPTRYIYDRLRELSKLHALDAAFLLYEAFKEVKETKAPTGFIYEDLVHYQLPLGGRWPVVTMNNHGKKRKYVHFRTTGTEVGDTYLCLGQSGVPFEFVTVPLSDHAFGNLECITYTHDDQLVLKTGFYVPCVKNEATFDGFIYNARMHIATVFQVTVGEKHSVKIAGLKWLKKLGVEKVNYVGVTLVGQSLLLLFDLEWVGFVEGIYQLPLEPICPKTLSIVDMQEET